MIVFRISRGVERPQVAFEGGEWAGDRRLLDWIEDNVRNPRKVLVTATGPDEPVDQAVPLSVLCLLQEDFGAVEIVGEMPPWPYGDEPGPDDLVAYSEDPTTVAF